MPAIAVSKKTWHTANICNQERVWKAEQDQEREKKKVELIRKQASRLDAAPLWACFSHALYADFIVNLLLHVNSNVVLSRQLLEEKEMDEIRKLREFPCSALSAFVLCLRFLTLNMLLHHCRRKGSRKGEARGELIELIVFVIDWFGHVGCF